MYIKRKEAGMRDNFFDFLRGIPFFEELCDDDIRSISKYCTDKVFEPGQIVFYPHLNIKKRNMKLGDFIYKLQKSVLTFLDEVCQKKYQFLTERKRPGIYWINEKTNSNDKIASIGLNVKQGFIQHGVAINFTNDLLLSKSIISCGEKNRKSVSLENIYPDIVNQYLKKNGTTFFKGLEKIFTPHNFAKTMHYYGCLILLYFFYKEWE